jgi:hypothetical protein
MIEFRVQTFAWDILINMYYKSSTFRPYTCTATPTIPN